MRLLCAVAPVLLALIVLNLVLQASGSWAAPPRRCLTYEEKSLGRLQTICSDGTRAVSTWSPAWQQWTTTVTLPPHY